MLRSTLAAAAASLITALSCSGSDAVTGSTTTTTDTLPSVFAHFSAGVTRSVQGSSVVLNSNGVPDHKSPYFGASDPRYEAYNGTNPSFALNPNTIVAQQFTFRIPLHPAVASVHQATPLGPIGIAVNGVPLFNQYAGTGNPLTFEINSFDQYNGHPQMTGVYHYHAEPYHITAGAGKSGLVGFLLDGFPVYGPVENGVTLSSASLDQFHGHVGATADYPAGIYHYHITADDPYINGAGFYGTPGTVGQ